MFDKYNCYPHKLFRLESCMGHKAQTDFDRHQLESATRTFLSRANEYNKAVGTKSALSAEQKEEIMPHLKMLAECGWPAEYGGAIIEARDYDTKSLDQADMAFKSIAAFSQEHGTEHRHTLHIAMHYIGEALARAVKFNHNHKPAGSPGGGQFDFAQGNGGSGGSGGTADRESPVSRFNPFRSGPAHADELPKPRVSNPIKVDDAVDHLVTHAKKDPPKPGKGECAKYVRQAIEAGGIHINLEDRHGSAKNYGITLQKIGFHPVAATRKGGDYPPKGYRPEKGDVTIIQNTSKSKDGHMAMFSGKQWVSDFKQHIFWPGKTYQDEKPEYVIYRASKK